MSVNKDQMDVIITVLILLEVIIVLVWMDMNWNQIIGLVQVITLSLANMYLHIITYKSNIICVLSIGNWLSHILLAGV